MYHELSIWRNSNILNFESISDLVSWKQQLKISGSMFDTVFINMPYLSKYWFLGQKYCCKEQIMYLGMLFKLYMKQIIYLSTQTMLKLSCTSNQIKELSGQSLFERLICYWIITQPNSIYQRWIHITLTFLIILALLPCLEPAMAICLFS